MLTLRTVIDVVSVREDVKFDNHRYKVKRR
jgi:hypothetical protein